MGLLNAFKKAISSFFFYFYTFLAFQFKMCLSIKKNCLVKIVQIPSSIMILCMNAPRVPPPPSLLLTHH